MTIEDDRLPDDNRAEQETIASDRPERAERIDDRHPRDRVSGREKSRDLRSIVKDAIKATDPAAKTVATAGKDAGASNKPRDPANGKFAPAAEIKPEDRGHEASPRDKESSEAQKPSETVPAAAPQAPAAVAAPAALSKEVKAIWDTLPEQVKAEFVKRETDTAKGVEKLKQQYKPIEDAVAPFRGQLQQLGKTDAEGVDQLFKWHAALSGPNKVQAFRALAQAHQINLTTLAPQAPAVASDPQTDPTQALRPLIDPLSQKVSMLETELQRRDRERVQSDIANFSKDKPHIDRVRQAMGHLINAGLAQGGNAKEIFDDAYARACRADPEVFASIQQEEQDKRDADARAAQEAASKKAAEEAEKRKRQEAEEVARARKAGYGPKSGSPVGRATASSPKGQSVGDTLRSAIKESSAAI